MSTRSQNNNFKLKKLLYDTVHPLPTFIKPTYTSQAIKDPKWHAAMVDEYNALLPNGTWHLIPPASHYNIIQ